jgi:hypothetical protein
MSEVIDSKADLLEIISEALASEEYVIAEDEIFNTINSNTFELSGDDKTNIIKFLLQRLVAWDKDRETGYESEALIAAQTFITLLPKDDYYAIFDEIAHRGLAKRQIAEKISIFSKYMDTVIKRIAVNLENVINHRPVQHFDDQKTDSKSAVLWVDDHPENNEDLASAIRSSTSVDIHCFESTFAVNEFLKANQDLIELGPNHFRIITDKCREEQMRAQKISNAHAGMWFITETRKKYPAMKNIPFLIYCYRDTDVIHLHNPEEYTFVTTDAEKCFDYASMCDLSKLK